MHFLKSLCSPLTVLATIGFLQSLGSLVHASATRNPSTFDSSRIHSKRGYSAAAPVHNVHGLRRRTIHPTNTPEIIAAHHVHDLHPGYHHDGNIVAAHIKMKEHASAALQFPAGSWEQDAHSSGMHEHAGKMHRAMQNYHVPGSEGANHHDKAAEHHEKERVRLHNKAHYASNA